MFATCFRCREQLQQSRSKRRASQPLAPPRPPPQPLLSCPTPVATHPEPHATRAAEVVPLRQQPLLPCPTPVATHQESRTPPAPSTPAGVPVPPLSVGSSTVAPLAESVVPSRLGGALLGDRNMLDTLEILSPQFL